MERGEGLTISALDPVLVSARGAAVAGDDPTSIRGDEDH
jgi:hypothetical protein